MEGCSKNCFLNPMTPKNWKEICLIKADKTAIFDFVRIKDSQQDTDTFSSSISIDNSEAEFKHSIIFINTANMVAQLVFIIQN